MGRMRAALAVALSLLPCLPALAGGTRADYERADALPALFRGKVLNERIDERWVDDETLLYRHQKAPDAYAWMRVDVGTGEPRAAFDAEKLAPALAQRLGHPVPPERLPLVPVASQGDGLVVLADAEVLLVGADGASLADADPESVGSLRLAPARTMRSEGGGRDTSILFVNRTEDRLDVLWLDFEGAPRSYGELAPGASRRQHTFPGHAWSLRAPDGSERGRFVARETPGVAVVEATPAAPEAAPRPRRPTHASSDGRHEAFVRDSNVHLRGPDGAARALTTDGTPDDPYTGRMLWSPDSRHLMVVRERPAERHVIHLIESSPRDRVEPRLHEVEYAKPGDRIAHPRPRIFDVEAGRPIEVSEDLFPSPWSLSEFVYSEDGRHLRFLYNERGHQVLRIVDVDVEAGSAHAFLEERSDTFVDYSQKSFLRWLPGGETCLWMSERSGFNHLYVAGDGTLEPLTEGPWLVRRVLDVDTTSGTVTFEALGVHPEEDPYHVHVGRVALATKEVTWLTEGDGTHELSFSPDGRAFVDRWSRVDLPPVHELRRTHDGALVCRLAEADWAPLVETGWAAPERFHAKGRDGTTDVWGLIFRPTDFDPAARYPVVEEIYAGPHGHFVPKAFDGWHGSRRLAELGFVVVRIDGMGTNWRSRAFHDVCWKNLSDAGLPDRVAWIRAAAATRPWMDLSRVGIWGGSAGGQNALSALLTHGDFYRVGVADCGCHDNRMDKIWWNEAWMGWPVGPEYEAQSNVTLAPRLEGKLLLIVGELDRNVDPASTMQVVDALVRADKDFDLLVMPGVGHGAAGTPYGRRRLEDFFVRHLLGHEPRIDAPADR